MSARTKTALIRAAGSCWLANGLWLSLPFMLRILRGSFTSKMGTECIPETGVHLEEAAVRASDPGCPLYRHSLHESHFCHVENLCV